MNKITNKTRIIYFLFLLVIFVPQVYAYGTEITHGNTAKKQVIFTFDGGATVESGDKILEVLKKHHIVGTFFLTGKMVETHPDLVKKIVSEGNEVFNHTYDHPHLPTITDKKIVLELDKMDNTFFALTGTSTKPYFRAPYGDRNAHVLSVASNAGYTSVYWTVDALDWKESSGETARDVKKRILSHVKPGTIYLMHIGDNITGAVLDDVFTTIESRGYSIVSLTHGI